MLLYYTPSGWVNRRAARERKRGKRLGLWLLRPAAAERYAGNAENRGALWTFAREPDAVFARISCRGGIHLSQSFARGTDLIGLWPRGWADFGFGATVVIMNGLECESSSS